MDHPRSGSTESKYSRESARLQMVFGHPRGAVVLTTGKAKLDIIAFLYA
jgi:hypothetical protein